MKKQPGSVTPLIPRPNPLPGRGNLIRQQTWIPMSLIFDVLYVAGSAIGFVGSYRLTSDARISLAHMAPGTGSARRCDVDGIKRRVATRAG